MPIKNLSQDKQKLKRPNITKASFLKNSSLQT